MAEVAAAVPRRAMVFKVPLARKTTPVAALKAAVGEQDTTTLVDAGTPVQVAVASLVVTA